ncbi:hypothetical protein Bhyg_16570, partial [Pseudolycoriella hygida]
MPVKENQNTEPKDDNKKLESAVNHSEENVAVTEEPPPFFDMGRATTSNGTDSSDQLDADTDADWK